jgi:hypothetical protein
MKTKFLFTENTVCVYYKTNQLMLFREIITVYCESYKKPAKTVRENVEFVNVGSSGVKCMFLC